MRHRRRLAAAPRLAAGVLAAAALAAGCDAGSDTELALTEAQATLAALHEAQPPAPPEFIAETHARIRSTLSPALNAESEATRSAAQVLAGQTHTGDAEVAAGRAEGLESQAADLMARAQTLAGRLYAWRHARADAAGSYAPDDTLASIGGAIADARAGRDRLSAERRELEARLAELRRVAAEATEEAERYRVLEAERRAEAVDLEGQERLDAIRAVYDAQRLSDDAVSTAAEYEARAAQLEPQIDAVSQRVAGAESFVELLRASRESVRERQARQARTAQVDREQASVASSDLDALLVELAGFRDGELSAAYEDALSAAGDAVSTLQRAGRGSDASPLWLASAHHTRADILSSRAASERRYARGLAFLAQLEPRLPYAGRLESRAKAARDRADRDRADALSAYESAASSYRQAASRGASGERLRALADRLEAVAAGEARPAPAEEAPAENS